MKQKKSHRDACHYPDTCRIFLLFLSQKS